MYESFYKFSERPFSLLPDPAFLYLSKKHRTALTLLEYGLNTQAGFTVITGEIGCGKTILVRQVLNELAKNLTVGLISNTHASFGEFMQWVLMSFGVDYRAKTKIELHETFVNFIIGEYAKNKRTVLVIDEAQNMSPAALEELRMLSNINADKDQVLQMVLVGQPELRMTLQQPGLEQFAQRILVHYHLDALDAEETSLYIQHRLKTAGGDPDLFDELARVAIWYHARGIPRLINTLCDIALVYAYADERKNIDARIIYDVVKDQKAGGLKYQKNMLDTEVFLAR